MSKRKIKQDTENYRERESSWDIQREPETHKRTRERRKKEKYMLEDTDLCVKHFPDNRSA